MLKWNKLDTWPASWNRLTWRARKSSSTMWTTYYRKKSLVLQQQKRIALNWNKLWPNTWSTRWNCLMWRAREPSSTMRTTYHPSEIGDVGELQDLAWENHRQEERSSNWSKRHDRVRARWRGLTHEFHQAATRVSQTKTTHTCRSRHNTSYCWYEIDTNSCNYYTNYYTIPH